MDLIGGNLSQQAMRHHILSARPDAPVVPARAHRTSARQRKPSMVRRGTATVLRRLADRIEPYPIASGDPACG